MKTGYSFAITFLQLHLLLNYYWF